MGRSGMEWSGVEWNAAGLAGFCARWMGERGLVRSDSTVLYLQGWGKGGKVREGLTRMTCNEFEP